MSDIILIGLGDEYEEAEMADETPTCDICDEPDDMNGEDWNSETGCHLSCEMWSTQ